MKNTHSIRIYIDTSVFGGVYDDEFSNSSKQLFKLIKKHLFVSVTSAVVNLEMKSAPKDVQALFSEIADISEIIEVTEEAKNLQNAYLKANILTPKSAEDALHVSLATVSHCTMIISWNFKHIVNFQKIPLYNAINQINGYAPIQIYSPREVIEIENENF